MTQPKTIPGRGRSPQKKGSRKVRKVREVLKNKETAGETPRKISRGGAEEVREVLKISALPVSWYLVFPQVSPFTDLTD